VTCHARLVVFSGEIVGDIVACPKCGMMVQIEPPEGWQPPPSSEQSALQSPAPDSASLSSGESNLENPTAESVAGDTSAVASAQGIKGVFFGLWHSWYAIAGVTVAAAAVCGAVWLTVFSGSESKSSSARVVAQSPAINDGETSSTTLEKSSDKSAEKTTEASSDKAVSEEMTEKVALENSASSETQSNAQPKEANASETNAAELKSANLKPTETDTAEVKSSSEAIGQEAKTSDKVQKHASELAVGSSKQPVAPLPGAVKLVKLVTPEEFDLQSRLGDVIPSVEFHEMPFIEAINIVSGMSSLSITLDPDAMARLGVTLRDPISIRLSNATVEEILQEMLSKRGMAILAADGQLLVTSPADEREKLRRMHYTVSDLTGDDMAAAEEMAVLVRKFIVPGSWKAGGGEGVITAEKKVIIVTQTAAIHDQIINFCEKLRSARGRPLKSNRNPKLFDLATRLEQAGPALNRQVSANFHEPATLADILAYLGRQAQVDILVDHQALTAAGVSDKTELSFIADNRPLAAVLDELLGALKLGYRAIDAHTLQVTSQSALDARRELEFYPVGKIVDKGLSGFDMIEKIKSTVAPASWDNADHSTAVFFDKSSKALIVLQSPPIQGAIQVFLNKTME
jgi:hypothetical protein